MRVKFTDGPDAVDLHTADGVVVVERDKPVDLPAATARQRVAAGWTEVKPPTKRAAAKKAAAPKPGKGAES